MDIRSFFGGSKASKPSSSNTSKENDSKIIFNKNKKEESDEIYKKNVLKETEKEEKDTVIKDAKETTKMNTRILERKSATKTSNEVPETRNTTTGTSSTNENSSIGSGTISNVEEMNGETIDIPVNLKSIITWNTGDDIPYKAVTDTFDRIANVSGRHDKEREFVRLFQAIVLTSPTKLEDVIYLVSNTVYPAFDGVELGIGPSLLVKAIVEATGRSKNMVDQKFKEEGDLGTVALESKGQQKTLSFAAKPKPLTSNVVLNELRKIANTKGNNSQNIKVNMIKGLMVKSTGSEAKYIIRALEGKLRIGTAAQTVLVGLAHCFSTIQTPVVKKMIKDDIDNPLPLENEAKKYVYETAMETDSDVNDNETDENKIENRVNEILNKAKIIEPAEATQLRNKWKTMSKETRNELAQTVVKRAFSECPTYGEIVQALLENPLYSVFKQCRLKEGIPVAPMLAKPTKEIGEVMKRLSGLEFTMEYKYDGERAQVHLLEDGTLKIFSRNSEDNSNKYQDLATVMSSSKKSWVKSCVIDAEVVAFDRERNVILPFQVLSTRKRKVEEGEDDAQAVKVALQGFDLLYLNGVSVLSLTLKERRELLRSSFNTAEGMFYFASGVDHTENGDTEPIENFLAEACAANSEGLMVKTLVDNSTYEPSKRSLNWLKLKKDYIDGMGVCDSVDLVVIGGYHGRGKRTNVYGAYLMACYDPDLDEYQSVCKVGTGFKDEDLVNFTEKMKDHIIPNNKKPFNYRTGDALEADDWFAASVVWELQAADLSKSSVHMGAIGRVDPNRGIGLRFPRFIRERDDKKAENATAAEQIADMYKSQGEVDAVENNDDDDDDEDIL